MRDAEGGDHTGEEKEFCSKCKKVLVKIDGCYNIVYHWWENWWERL
jgi:hypothetical protein